MSGGRAGTGPDDVQRLGRAGIAWRAVVLVVGTGWAFQATIAGNDVNWPFAPMAQFAFRVGENDSIRSTFLQARTATGEVLVVPLSSPSVGVGRAEVEGQIPAMQREPRLLGDLAVTYGRLHPQAPPLVQLWLRQRVVDLRAGRTAGERVDELVGWTAPGTEPAPAPAAPVVRRR